jgi:hypothetical protein
VAKPGTTLIPDGQIFGCKKENRKTLLKGKQEKTFLVLVNFFLPVVCCVFSKYCNIVAARGGNDYAVRCEDRLSC